jgi:hypothetical protein
VCACFSGWSCVCACFSQNFAVKTTIKIIALHVLLLLLFDGFDC